MTPHKSNKSPSPEEKDKNTPSQRFEEEHLLSSSIPSEDAILPSSDDISELHEQVQTLTKALKESEEKASSHWDRILRREAEYQNFQKRAEQDLENARKFSLERFARDLLQVLDSLEQGLSFSQNDQTSIKDLQEGMRLTQASLLNVLENQGIKPIDPKVGDAFDPNFHEAISMQESKELAPNRIVTVVQRGYMLHNRLLRAARVVVSSVPQ